jgi:hypothetical protein
MNPITPVAERLKSSETVQNFEIELNGKSLTRARKLNIVIRARNSTK